MHNLVVVVSYGKNTACSVPKRGRLGVIRNPCFIIIHWKHTDCILTSHLGPIYPLNNNPTCKSYTIVGWMEEGGGGQIKARVISYYFPKTPHLLPPTPSSPPNGCSLAVMIGGRVQRADRGEETGQKVAACPSEKGLVPPRKGTALLRKGPD